jgi:hypothetical protein
MIAPDFDLHRISERREANELNGSADQQTHLQQTPALVGGNFDFQDGSGATHRK